MLAQKPEDVVGVGDANCYFLSYHLPDGQIVSARIVVNSDHDEIQIAHCLLEELTQSMGLPNDDGRIIPSIFNDDLKLDDLSLIDKVLVRVLYDPRMAAGTPRDRALDLARDILAQLNPEG